MKYYFAWGLAEAASIASQYGYNGTSDGDKEEKRHKWSENIAICVCLSCNICWLIYRDRCRNADVVAVEFATSFALLPRDWNICTGTFLRRCAFASPIPHEYHHLVWSIRCLRQTDVDKCDVFLLRRHDHSADQCTVACTHRSNLPHCVQLYCFRDCIQAISCSLYRQLWPFLPPKVRQMPCLHALTCHITAVSVASMGAKQKRNFADVLVQMCQNRVLEYIIELLSHSFLGLPSSHVHTPGDVCFSDPIFQRIYAGVRFHEVHPSHYLLHHLSGRKLYDKKETGNRKPEVMTVQKSALPQNNFRTSFFKCCYF